MTMREMFVEATYADRRDRGEYAESFGKWISGVAEWQWFVTVTLDPVKVNGRFDKPGMGTARWALRELLVRSRAKSVVCVFELQRSGVPHLHALLAGCPAIHGGVAMEWFDENFGMNRWKVFKQDAGAPAYIGKYLAKDVVELYVGTQGPWTMGHFKEYPGGAWSVNLGGLRV